MITEIHDSNSCELGLGGEPCEMCKFANEQEKQMLAAKGQGFTESEKAALARIAEDCDPAVLQRISTAIRQDQTFASLTTVATAIYDVIDGGDPNMAGRIWFFYEQINGMKVWDEDSANKQRCDFVDAVCNRITELQREPHGMDAGLRVVREDVAEMGRLVKERINQ